MAGSPDLFVVCKNCRAEVSPYITECPYCGHRLRKRAPKLEKGSVPRAGEEPKPPKPPKAPKRRRAKPQPAPSPPRRQRSFSSARATGKPVATMGIVLVSALATIAYLVSASAAEALVFVEVLQDEPWKLLTTAFVYPATDFGGTSYQLVALASIFLFGWLLERRHGAWAPLLVFLAGVLAGNAVAVALPGEVILMGANSGALALLAAWVVRDLLALRRGEEVDSDLLGVVAIAVVLALLPAAIEVADPIAGMAGAVVGLLLGFVLARLPER